MKQTIQKPSDLNISNKPIEIMEVGLTSVCNLKCPLCTRNKKIFTDKDYPKYSKTHIDIKKLLEFIDFIGPSEIKLVGAVGEPTLHPGFTEFVEALKSRNIKIWLSTNGSTHTPSWWENLGKVIPENSIINMDIDHSDEEKQKIYRRGSSLTKILANHKALIINKQNWITQIQKIDFDWNSDDTLEKLKMDNAFDNISIIPCYDYDPNEYVEDLSFWTHPKEQMYKALTKGSRKTNIECEAKKHKMIYVNYLGEVMPCCYINDEVLKNYEPHYNIYEIDFGYLLKEYFSITNNPDNPNNQNYSNICNRYCNKFNKKLCNIWKLDP